MLIENGNYYMLNGGILPSGYLNEYNTNENFQNNPCFMKWHLV